MSGRSGYRKTDRKRSGNARPAEKADYVVRLKLPAALAFAISPGEHGFGITVGFNDTVFAHGRSPAHCSQLAADFLNGIGARDRPQVIYAKIVKLLPCPADARAFDHRDGFRPLGIDLEAVHDNLSRNAQAWRACAVTIGADAITFAGLTPKPIIHDFTDCGDRERA